MGIYIYEFTFLHKDIFLAKRTSDHQVLELILDEYDWLLCNQTHAMPKPNVSVCASSRKADARSFEETMEIIFFSQCIFSCEDSGKDLFGIAFACVCVCVCLHKKCANVIYNKCAFCETETNPSLRGERIGTCFWFELLYAKIILNSWTI